jgi:hypothetical protein
MQESILMIASDTEFAVRADKREALRWLWPVSNDIAKAEDRVDIAHLAIAKNLLERNSVSMNVGDDG